MEVKWFYLGKGIYKGKENRTLRRFRKCWRRCSWRRYFIWTAPDKQTGHYWKTLLTEFPLLEISDIDLNCDVEKGHMVPLLLPLIANIVLQAWRHPKILMGSFEKVYRLMEESRFKIAFQKNIDKSNIIISGKTLFLIIDFTR